MSEAKLRELNERIQKLEAELTRRQTTIPSVVRGLLTFDKNVDEGDWESYESVTAKIRVFERDSQANNKTTWKATSVEVNVELSPPGEYVQGAWICAIRDDDGVFVAISSGCDPTATGAPPGIEDEAP